MASKVLLHEGNKLALEIHPMILDVWSGALVSQNWIDAIHCVWDNHKHKKTKVMYTSSPEQHFVQEVAGC